MEFVMAIVIGILFMAAVYLILSRSLLKIILGTGLAESWCTFAHLDDGWSRWNFAASTC